MTVQDQKPMDFRDYLSRQQQQWQQDQIDKLFPSDEDRNAELAQRIEDQAYDSAEGAAVDASDAEEALTDVVTHRTSESGSQSSSSSISSCRFMITSSFRRGGAPVLETRVSLVEIRSGEAPAVHCF
jgi:hypothetical protein